MNAYNKLKTHLELNMYRRGLYKGDAPLVKRSKRNLRVVTRSDSIAVVAYRTDIITAYPDGTFTLRANGWDSSPTTREAFGAAFRIMGFFGGLYTSRKHGVSQTWMQLGDNSYVFADGMEFDAEGHLTSAAPAVKAKRIDRDESREFMNAVKASGFKDTFKLLFATAPAPEHRVLLPLPMRELLTNVEHAQHWMACVQKHAYQLGWVNGGAGTIMVRKIISGPYKRDPETGVWRRKNTPQTAAQCWTAIMNECKQDMYNVVPLENI